jgi:hypothetical protein
LLLGVRIQGAAQPAARPRGAHAKRRRGDAERLRGVGAGEVEPGGEDDRLAVQRRQREQRRAQLAVVDPLRGVGAERPGLEVEQRVQRPRAPAAAARVRQDARVTPISQPSSAPRGIERWRRQAIA